MDLVNSAYVRAYLEGVEARVTRAAEVLDWLDGTQTLNEEELVPPITTPQQRKAWDRFRKQAQSLGPRVINVKAGGAIGGVNWGGDNPNGIDERLDALDLDALAREALKPLVGLGMAAMWAYQPEVGSPRVQLLGGYVEPLYDGDDAAGTPVALYQVRADPEEPSKYVLRIYEFDPEDESVGTIYEWRKADKAYAVGTPPTSVIEGASMPRYAMWGRSQDGVPLGEVMQALPLLKADVARQIEQLRISGENANPIKWAVGDWDFGDEHSPADVLVAQQEGSQLGRVDPPLFEGGFRLHDRTLERLQGDLSMPVASITTGAYPSGEALDLANEPYNRNVARIAMLLSRLLTLVAGDFAVLHGINRDAAPSVSVTVNRERVRRQVTEQARLDYRDGLISFRAAVLTVAQYYPHWSDEEIEEFIAEQTARVSVDDFNAFVTGQAQSLEE